MEKKDKIDYWQLIWDKFKAGDRAAFETIYNEFIDVLFAYGAKITSDRTILEDAIQEVFINIYTYGKSLRQPELLEFYLFKTLKHNLFRNLKEKYKYDLVIDEIEHFDLRFPIEELDEKIIQERRLRLLQMEIKKLDVKKRELLYLKFNSGLTNLEIGKLLDMKEDTVKKQVQRLIKYFRKEFGDSLLNLLLICYRT